MAQVAVIGAGYVGLTTAAGFSHLRHDVVCADIDVERVEMLQRGEVPIVEAGLERLVREGLEGGRLRFVVGAAQAVGDAEFAIPANACIHCADVVFSGIAPIFFTKRLFSASDPRGARTETAKPARARQRGMRACANQCVAAERSSTEGLTTSPLLRSRRVRTPSASLSACESPR